MHRVAAFAPRAANLCGASLSARLAARSAARALQSTVLRPLVAGGAPALVSALSTAAASPAAAATAVDADLNNGHPNNNVPPSIKARIGRNLHLDQTHPLGLLKQRIQEYFEALGGFKTFDQLQPIVSVRQNFDDLLTPADHVSRRPTDTFYVDEGRLLRCHMTAHQTDLIRQAHSAFLMIGDVYRRDEVDATHYPVFHQVDGVRVWSPSDLPPQARGSREAAVAFVVDDLKRTLEGLVQHLFGKVEMRWIEAYFPFTDPSLELEIFFEGKWLEVLGSGMIRQQILTNCERGDAVGWAFGMGLERLAMVKYDIPDIRLFWTEDSRFHSQFKPLVEAVKAGSPTLPSIKFTPYSKYPMCYKDITFWLPNGPFHENDFFACVREVAGDLVERVEALDAFKHPKTGRTSHCYRISYRSMDRNLRNEEIDALQAKVRQSAVDTLKVELR